MIIGDVIYLKNPCRGCLPPVRCVGCHSKCKEYLAWDEQHKKVLAEQRRESDLELLFSKHLLDRKINHK